VGNGRMGAMVFGNPDRERIQLNEDSMWAGELKDVKSSIGTPADLAEVRKLIDEDRLEEADQELIKRFSRGAVTAREQCGMRGWMAHHASELYVQTVMKSARAYWGGWIHGGGWMCQHVWTNYDYTRDRKFLEETGYPKLRSGRSIQRSRNCVPPCQARRLRAAFHRLPTEFPRESSTDRARTDRPPLGSHQLLVDR
jgi:hypothetical protein